VTVRILLVEDDEPIARSLVDGLATFGHIVEHVATGDLALASGPVDLVLLDLGLPDVDGRHVCRELRARSAVPIIILTARIDELDRVLGLELGADDYITKPFSLRELVARVRAVTRRFNPTLASERSNSDSDSQHIGPLSIDRRLRRVHVDGVEVSLTAKDFDLLAYLATDAGAAYSRSDILKHVWDVNYFGPTKTVDAHIAVLRRTLGHPEWITAVRGIGFRLEPPP
jgi:two-component system, OmpR family, response regulator RegX3